MDSGSGRFRKDSLPWDVGRGFGPPSRALPQYCLYERWALNAGIPSTDARSTPGRWPADRVLTKRASLVRHRTALGDMRSGQERSGSPASASHAGGEIGGSPGHARKPDQHPCAVGAGYTDVQTTASTPLGASPSHEATAAPQGNGANPLARSRGESLTYRPGSEDRTAWEPTEG